MEFVLLLLLLKLPPAPFLEVEVVVAGVLLDDFCGPPEEEVAPVPLLLLLAVSGLPWMLELRSVASLSALFASLFSSALVLPDLASSSPLPPPP